MPMEPPSSSRLVVIVLFHYEFSDLARLTALENIEKNGQGVAVGSRAHQQDEAVAKVEYTVVF